MMSWVKLAFFSPLVITYKELWLDLCNIYTGAHALQNVIIFLTYVVFNNYMGPLWKQDGSSYKELVPKIWKTVSKYYMHEKNSLKKIVLYLLKILHNQLCMVCTLYRLHSVDHQNPWCSTSQACIHTWTLSLRSSSGHTADLWLVLWRKEKA